MSKLFHSLVVCGAGLTALQCGGKALQSGEDPNSGESGGAPSSAGSSSTQLGGRGGSFSVGGSMSIGGALSTGGTLGFAGAVSAGGTLAFGGAVSVGGNVGVGASGGVGAALSPWQQWDCTAFDTNGCVGVGTTVVSGFGLIQACRVEPTRPRSQADCQPGQIFSCLIGVLGNQYGPINCECLPPSSGVPCFCSPSIVSCASAQPVACGTDQSYCGCAYTCILK
jgi:hypothetical protein